MVAGCPSPAEHEASWSIFRNDAEDWWDEIASQESETQHRTREFTEWVQGRSFRNKHAQVRRKTAKELDTRGVPTMGEEETESPQTTWHREQDYQIDLFSLTSKDYEKDMRIWQ